MRTFLAAVALLASLMSSLAADDSKNEALQVLAKWSQAFKDLDVDAIVKLYAPDALFVGTGSKTVVVKPGKGFRSYFENALLNNRPRGASLGDYSVMPLSDTAAVVTGLDTVTGVRDGKPFSANGRVTFVVASAARTGRSCISIGRPCQTNIR